MTAPSRSFVDATPVGAAGHVVERHETLESIALRYGHFWQTIWNEPANRALRDARQDHNVLLPGDRVTIPPLRPGQLTCATGRRHVFRRKGVPSRIAFELGALGGKPLAGKRYLLILGNVHHDGRTTAEGRVEVFVSAFVTSGSLTVWLDEEDQPESITWPFEIGTLLPIGTVRGIRQRLANLGFHCGDGDGFDDDLRSALAAFQQWAGREATGDPDAATLDRLSAASRG